MKAIAAALLLALLTCVSPGQAIPHAGEPTTALASSDAAPPIRVSPAVLARIVQDAAVRMRSLADRATGAEALIDAIATETDPAAREAQWSAWLDTLARTSSEYGPVVLERLAVLADSAPVVGIPHHEFPSRTMPAFSVAGRADALLARHDRLNRARRLAASPEELARALEADAGSPRFDSGLDALALVSPELLSGVVETARRNGIRSGAAARIALAAAKVDSDYSELLPQVVERGETAVAIDAIRLAMDRSVPELREIAVVALGRPELGGLSLAAARQAGMHPDDYCWALLGDLAVGADAARLLAQHSVRLTHTIASRVDKSPPLARLRMLLALRLRDSDAARGLLGELADAPWISEQQRREVRSWL